MSWTPPDLSGLANDSYYFQGHDRLLLARGVVATHRIEQAELRAGGGAELCAELRERHTTWDCLADATAGDGR